MSVNFMARASHPIDFSEHLTVEFKHVIKVFQRLCEKRAVVQIVYVPACRFDTSVVGDACVECNNVHRHQPNFYA